MIGQFYAQAHATIGITYTSKIKSTEEPEQVLDYTERGQHPFFPG